MSRTQFDGSMERLNEVIQEMLSRVMGQEQDWHQIQRQLSEEMDSKVRGGMSPLCKTGTFGAWQPKAASF